MIQVRSYALVTASVQQIEVPAGSRPASAHLDPAGWPHAAFLVDPQIDALETWDILLISEWGAEVSGSVDDSWIPLGCAHSNGFGYVHAFAKKAVTT